MNYKKACKTLDISENEDELIDIDKLKRQYRTKALLYHPDKNPSIDAASKFQEIRESYEFLMKYQCYMDSDNDENEIDYFDTNEPTKGTYRWILYSFLKNILKTESNHDLFYTIIKRISNTCEKTAIETLEKLDKFTLIKIYDILKKYRDSFHFTDCFIEKIENILSDKTKNDECIILNPTLDDLFENNLYRLKVNDYIYVVPLWHHELVYDNSGNDIYVKCYPMLPENVEIDEKNNIHINVNYKIPDIWLKESIDINVGKKTFKITPNLLKLKINQTIIFAQQGISKVNTEFIYDITKLGDVLININLEL
jgi:hypothetical protein